MSAKGQRLQNNTVFLLCLFSSKVDRLLFPLNGATRPVFSRLERLCSWLICTGHCTGTYNKNLFGPVQTGLSKGAARHEELRETPHMHALKSNTASSCDEFIHNKSR
ncbi:hypothetical protein XENOCAPTIV_022058 [Xenoophorus captivus]|uniref:Secreted protein n=1 Tax=Xenoophorus captivus TaxID=1517983 RepID=A0ABV0QWD6_9TELE